MQERMRVKMAKIKLWLEIRYRQPAFIVLKFRGLKIGRAPSTGGSASVASGILSVISFRSVHVINDTRAAAINLVVMLSRRLVLLSRSEFIAASWSFRFEVRDFILFLVRLSTKATVSHILAPSQAYRHVPLFTASNSHP